jgi:hypothetical protein
MDCFGQPLLYHSYYLKAHSSLPFHSIKKETGNIFKRISLNVKGFIVHLGHRGPCCPANVTSATEPEVAEAEECDIVDKVLLEGWEPRDKKTLGIVDVSKVHHVRVPTH